MWVLRVSEKRPEMRQVAVPCKIPTRRIREAEAVGLSSVCERIACLRLGRAYELMISCTPLAEGRTTWSREHLLLA
jgi:hypothetical protein